MSEQERPFSAVILSKKRKVQIGFDEAQTMSPRRPERPPSSSSSARAARKTRPSTHEGHAPAPPPVDRHAFKALSPRQISLNLSDIEISNSLESPFSADPERVLELSASDGRPTVVTTNKQESTCASSAPPLVLMDSSAAPTVPGSSRDKTSQPLQPKQQQSQQQQQNLAHMIPAYIKSRTAKDAANEAKAETANAFAPTLTTQYPSLSHRLIAVMSVNGSFKSAPSAIHTHRRSSPKQKKAKKLTSHSKETIQNLYQQTKIKRKRRLFDEVSVSSDVFDKMNIEEMIEYLINFDGNGSRPEFLHVTSRYHVEKLRVTNFYDLVLLEQPGHPHSGYVWTRDHKKYRTHPHDVLENHQIMQLSVNGLLLGTGELIPIQQLLQERDQFDFLRTGRFFGMFKEFKAFSAWKKFTQHSYVQRMKRQLVKETFFSEPELVEAILVVIRTTYDIQKNTDFFHFSGRGSVCVSDFFREQTKKIQETALLLQKQIEDLGNLIAEIYWTFIRSVKLQERIQDVKDHHPLRDFMQPPATPLDLTTFTGRPSTANNPLRPSSARPATAGLSKTFLSSLGAGSLEEKIEWVRFRSMQRLGDNFKQKIAQILYLAQFCIEYSVACIMEKFWLRLKQFFLGVYQLDPSRRSEVWELDKSLFDEAGTLSLDELNDPFISLVPAEILADQEKQRETELAIVLDKQDHTTDDGEKRFEADEDDDDRDLKDKLPFFEQHRRLLHYQRIVRELCPSQKVNHEWEKQGCHLSLLVNLHFDEDSSKKLEIRDLMHLGNHNIERVHVSIFPSKADAMNDMHTLCGSLGTLLEMLPNLKFHPLICTEETKFLYKRQLMYQQNRYNAESNDTENSMKDEEGDKSPAKENLSLADVVAMKQRGEAISQGQATGAQEQISTQRGPTPLDSHPSSNNYFTFLIMAPVFNCRNNYQLALDSIKYFHLAYQQASNVDNYRTKLLEIVRKLWSLSPVLLVKQLERALALRKIEEFVENPDVVEDLHRSQDRDKGRLQTYRNALEYVDRLCETQLMQFMTLKHSMGLVTSFRPVLLQIYAYRMVQDFHLHYRLNASFILRCSLLYDFVRSLENAFDNNEVTAPTQNSRNSGEAFLGLSQQEVRDIIVLLLHIKNFDEVKPSFDVEIEINEVLYQIITQYNARKAEMEDAQFVRIPLVMHRDAEFVQQFGNEFTQMEQHLQICLSKSIATHKAIANPFVSGRKKALDTTPQKKKGGLTNDQLANLTPDKLYRVLNEALERLSGILARNRSSLLSVLLDVKTFVLQSRQDLLQQIRTQLDLLNEFQIVLPDYVMQEIRSRKIAELSMQSTGEGLHSRSEDFEFEFDHHVAKSVVEISQFINSAGREVETLRRLVNESISAQRVLLESHDIVGAANAILVTSELQDFSLMDELETVYNHRCQVWKVITDTEKIRKNLYNAKLGNQPVIIELHQQFLSTLALYKRLCFEIYDDATQSPNDVLDEFDEDGNRITEQPSSKSVVNTSKLSRSQLLIEPMKIIIEDVLPKVETAVYLASKHLKSRHWVFLNRFAFMPVKLVLKFSGRQGEFISVVDVSGSENNALASLGGASSADATGTGLGNIHRLPVRELCDRHVQTKLEQIRYITSEAMIEAIMDKTLVCIEQTLRVSSVQLSTLWLRDSRLREKLFNELNEFLNLIPLRVMSRYCWKAVTIVETTSQDMCLSSFDQRIERTKDFIFKLDKFFENYREIQYYWNYVLIVIKFIGRNDIDRDMLRVFNNVTEEMKKVEMQFIQKNGNLYATFAANMPSSASLSSTNVTNASAPEEKADSLAPSTAATSTSADVMNTENMKVSLSYILEDIHSIIQSLLDACPRLSLMSYNKLVVFYKVWLFGPQINLTFVSDCMHDLFEGVGKLRCTLQRGQKLFICDGFSSTNGLEVVRFANPIPLTISLEDFVTRFEEELRCSMEKSCDVIVLHRVNCIRALLGEQENAVIATNIKAILQNRTEHLKACIGNEHVNQVLLLMNMCSFAEDLWTCLGHPTGALTMAKPDLVIESPLFTRNWRASLQALVETCKESIVNLQDWMLIHDKRNNDHLLFTKPVSFYKAKQLFGNLLLQEISFLRLVTELEQCTCVESATELWAGKYQFRFEYMRDNRYHHSPFDITLGNIAIPYGLEYFEGGNVTVLPTELEYAVGRVLSSAFSLRGVTFINAPSDTRKNGAENEAPSGSNQSDFANFFHGHEGDYCVTGKDIATALGRLCCTLSDASHATNVRFFFSRLIYLDAVGCVDFTTINQENLQFFIQSAQSFWSALENKNDQFIQDSCKFPIKTKFTRSEVQAERRKNNLTNLRNDLNFKKKSNIYMGFIFIGFASEAAFSSLAVFDQFYRSIFDSISMSNAKPIDHIGTLLTVKGFRFGIELESVFKQSVLDVLKFVHTTASDDKTAVPTEGGSTLAQSGRDLVQLLLSSRELFRIVHDSGLSLALFPHTVHFANNKNFQGELGRFYLEILCFFGNVWERMIVLSVEAIDDLKILIKIRNEFFSHVQCRLEPLINADELERFQSYFANESLFIRRPVHHMLLKVAARLGYVMNDSLLKNCVLLWENILENTSPIFVLQGEAGAGKTAVREIVVQAINQWHWEQSIEKLRLIRKRLDAKNITTNTAMISEESSFDELKGHVVIDTHMLTVVARVAAKRIFIVLRNWWKMRLKVKEIVSLEESRQQLLQSTVAAVESAEGNHSSQKITSETSSNKGSEEADTAKAPQADDTTSKPTSPKTSSTVPPVKNYKTKSTNEKSMEISLEEALKSRLRTTVIFHASLPANALIGDFDSQGRWNDGILLRKLRHIHEITFNQQAKLKNHRLGQNLLSADSAELKKSQQQLMVDSDKLHFIVLDGPLSYSIEQLLQSVFFQSFNALNALSARSALYNHLSFPTGEVLSLPDNLRIVLETSDLSHASPTCLSVVPCQKLHFTTQETYRRLLTVWMRSIFHWLGDFPPWLDFLEELQWLLMCSEFVEDLLYDDLNSSQPCVGLILSKVSSFSRILEELLLQIQEMALATATFTIYTDKEDSSSDSDEDDVGNGENGEETDTDGSVVNNDSTKKANFESEIDRVMKKTMKKEQEMQERENEKALLQAKLHFKGAMSLNSKGRELLLRRAKTAIIFAAVWGFGAVYNSTDKRKFFDSMVRDIIHQYLDIPDGDDVQTSFKLRANAFKARPTANSMTKLPVSITTDCSVFECILSLEDCSIIPAYHYDPRSKHTVLHNDGLPDKFKLENIFCEQLLTEQNRLESLQFHSMNTRAIFQITKLLVSTGANVLLFGVKGCGKTKLLNDVLADLKKHCPTPDDMREQIMTNLISIINGTAQTQGVFRALEIMQSILAKSSSGKLSPEFGEDFNSYWRKLGEELLHGMWSDSPRKHCKNKSVTSCDTTMRSFTSSSDLRRWLEREFASETKYVLETSRFTYGLAFIDDLHCLETSASDSDNNESIQQQGSVNRCDELLRGIFYGHDAFSIKRNVSVRISSSLGYHQGSTDALFSRSVHKTSSVLHRESQTDMRFALTPSASDDMMLQQLGVVSGATGHGPELLKTDVNSSSLRNLVSYFSCLSLPTFSITEIHAAFLTGTLVAMSSAELQLKERRGLMIEVFKQEIVDLSKMMLQLCRKLVSSNDALVTTSTEKILRSCIIPNVSFVSRFCAALFHGSAQIRNPAGLLELFAHEWKRFFLDPLPEGSTQYERNSNLVLEQIDALEERNWFVTRNWLEELKQRFVSSSAPVWTNENCFSLTSEEADPNDKIVYRPLKLCASHENKDSTIPTNAANEAVHEREIFVTNRMTDSEVKSLLFPQAFSFVLRVVRILTVVGKHALLASYASGSRSKLLLLASKICKLIPFKFAPKDTVAGDAVESQASEKASKAASFKNFVKSVVLRASGFTDPMLSGSSDNNGTGQVLFNKTKPIKCMMIIEGAQQMAREDRRLLLNIVDREDPSFIFADAEIQGMADCLRRLLKQHNAEEHNLSLKLDGAMPSTKQTRRLQSIVDEEGRARSGRDEDHLAAWTSPAFKSSLYAANANNVPGSSLTGYTFNWIRDFLRSSLMDNVHIVMIVELTRPMEVDPSVFHSNAEALKLLRKGMGSQTYKKANNNVKHPKTACDRNSNAHKDTRCSQSRYSLLSTRHHSSMRSQHVADIYDPTSDVQQALKADGFEVAAEQSAGHVAEHSLFTCSIIGPVLANKFHFLWHGLSFQCAVQGITKATFHTHTTSLFSSSKEATSLIIAGSICVRLVSAQVGLYYESKVAASTGPASALNKSGVSSTQPQSSRRISAQEKELIKRQSVRRSTFMKMSHANNASSNSRSRSQIQHESTENKADAAEEEAEEKGEKFALKIHFHDRHSALYAESNPPPPVSAPPTTVNKRDSSQRTVTFANNTSNKDDGAENVTSMQSSQTATTLISRRTLLSFDDALPFFTFSLFDKFGVFNAFSFPDSTFSHAESLSEIELMVAHMTQQVEVALPFLLLTPLPCDALFLQQPLLFLDEERIAAQSMQYACHIVETQGRQLCAAKHVYEKILVAYDEAIFALDNTDYMDSKLIENNEELIGISRKISRQVEATRRELENVEIDYSRTSCFERELMLGNEILSKQIDLDNFESQMTELFQAQRKRLLGFKAQAWQAFSMTFTSKPYPKPMVDLMRAVMILVNYSPPKLAKKEKDKDRGGGDSERERSTQTVKMDDDMVARCSMSLIMKFNDFTNQLQAVSPTSLSRLQLNALRIMNPLLNPHKSSYINHEMNSPPARAHYYRQHFLNDDPTHFPANAGSAAMAIENNASSKEEGGGIPTIPAHPLFDVMRKFLILVDLSAAGTEFISQQRALLSEKRKDLATLESFNTDEKSKISLGLRENLELAMQQLSLVDATVSNNRAKLDTIEKSRLQQVELSKGLIAAREFAQSELHKIEDCLEDFVEDICIASVVFFRASWLPDTMRQECLEVLRQELRKDSNIEALLSSPLPTSKSNKHKQSSHEDIPSAPLSIAASPVTFRKQYPRSKSQSFQRNARVSRARTHPSNRERVANPLVFGSMLDRVQCRQWIKYNEHALANDIPSLNSMSLLFFSPFHTLVVDPDGCALSAILEAIPVSFKTFLQEDTEANEKQERSASPSKDGSNRSSRETHATQFDVQEDALFDCYIVTAQKFSLTVFETWVQTLLKVRSSEPKRTTSFEGFGLRESNLTNKANAAQSLQQEPKQEKGLFVVINDVQSGSSDDLICLLSSRIVSFSRYRTRRKAADETLDEEQEKEEREEEEEEEIEKFLEIAPRSGSRQSSDLVRLPNRFRLVLLSSIAPTLSVDGVSHPLPISCFRYLHTLHWSVGLTSQCIVEKVPVQSSMEQVFACDHTVSHRLAWKLCASLAPSNIEQLGAYNRSLLLESTQLISVERAINAMVFEWMWSEHDVTTKDFAIEGLVEQGAVSLSILSRDDIILSILQANPLREQLQASIEKELGYMRECVVYFSTMKEVFAMTSDYLRMCAQFLPVQAFSPHALTTNALATHFLPAVVKFIKRNKAFAHFPPSLFAAWRALRAVISIQRLFRMRRAPGAGSDKAPSLVSENRSKTSSSAKVKRLRERAKEQEEQNNVNVNANANTSSFSSYHPEESTRDCALSPSLRRRACEVLNFKLLPLRSLFLREIVRYLQLHIRPGLENLLKLLLILTTWAQSDPVPVEEVRSLFYLLLEGKGFRAPRFCHYFHVKDPHSERAPVVIGRANEEEKAPVDRIEENENEFEENEVTAPLIDFSTPSPTFLLRKTAAPPSHAKRPMSGKRSGPSSRPISATKSDEGRTFMCVSYYESILERGSGLPDGIWLNKRSLRYAAAVDPRGVSKNSGSVTRMSSYDSFPSVMGANANASQSHLQALSRPKFLSLYDYGVHFYGDEHTYIAQRSRLLRMTGKSGDPFELEWLRSRGLCTFSTLNNHAVLALGASKSAAQEIQRSRQTHAGDMPTSARKKSSFVVKKGIGSARPSKIAVSSGKSANGNDNSRRKSSMRSLFFSDSTASISSASSTTNEGNSTTAARALLSGQARRLTNRASNLLENIASNVRQSRRVVLSSALASRWSRRQSTAISVAQTTSTPSRSSQPQALQQRSSSGSSTATANQLTALTGIAPGSDFTELVYDERTYLNLLVLESHPSLSSVFKGITAGIQRNILDFVEWKENLVYLENLDCKRLSEQELLSLLQGVLPPKCTDVEEAGVFGVVSENNSNKEKDKDSSVDHEEGAWARGFELTVVQSWLLGEALWPGSTGNLLEVLYTLLGHYLQKDGYLVVHRDEEITPDEDALAMIAEEGESSPSSQSQKTTSKKNRVKRTISFADANSSARDSLLKKSSEDDDEDEEDDFDEEDTEGEGADEDTFDASAPLSASRKPSAQPTRSHTSSSHARSTFLQRMDDYSAMLNASSLQDDVPIINSWSKLLHLVSLSPTQLSRIGPELENAWSSTAISCRDFHNWEVVVMEICREYTADVDKFVFMKELRETLFHYRRRPTLFLVPWAEGSQNAIFSQRVRDFALQAGGKQIPIIYCSTAPGGMVATSPSSYSAENDTDGSDQVRKEHLLDTLKTVRSALSSTQANNRKAILEMVDLSSSSGNAVVYAVLLPSALSGASMVNVSYTGHSVTPCVNNTTTGNNASMHAYASTLSSSSAAAATAGNAMLSLSNWKENCPLVISSLWSQDFDKQRTSTTINSSVTNSNNVLFKRNASARFAPPYVFSELSYVWLPRFFPPDITRKYRNPHIQSATNTLSDSSALNILKESEEHPSLPESCGILYEEMESTLIWVMNASKSILQTRITTEIQNTLKRMNKMELRMTACVLTIWQLVLYIRSRLYEDAGLPADWSSCLNSLQLWPLSRLMLKVCEFLQSKAWYAGVHDNVDSEDTRTSKMLVILQENFQHGIRCLMECFSRCDMNFYQDGSEEANGKKDDDDDDDDEDAPPSSAQRARPPPPATAAATNFLSPRRRPVRTAQQSQPQPESDRRANKCKSTSEREEFQLLSSIRQLHISLQQKKSTSSRKRVAAAAAAAAATSSSASTAVGASALPQSVNSIARLRAQKQIKRAMRKLDEARNLYLLHLQRVDRLALRRLSLPADTMSRRKREIDNETTQRLYSLLSHYVAEILVEKQTARVRRKRELLAREGDAPPSDATAAETAQAQATNASDQASNSSKNKQTRKLSFNAVVDFAVNARRHSSKMNIKPIFSNRSGSPTKNNAEAERHVSLGETETEIDTRSSRQTLRKTISSSVDVMFGSLQPRDMLVCMVDWTTDKHTGVLTSTGGVDRMKILQAIVRLSYLVRKGVVKLSFDDVKKDAKKSALLRSLQNKKKYS